MSAAAPRTALALRPTDPHDGNGKPIKNAAEVLPLWLKGYTQVQIAKRLGVTVGSVSSTVSRARRAGIPLSHRQEIKALKPVNSDDKIAISQYTNPQARALKRSEGPVCRISCGRLYLHKTAEGLTPHTLHAWQGRRAAAEALINLLPIDGLAIEPIKERAAI